jgi:hypothetical protein
MAASFDRRASASRTQLDGGITGCRLRDSLPGQLFEKFRRGDADRHRAYRPARLARGDKRECHAYSQENPQHHRHQIRRKSHLTIKFPREPFDPVDGTVKIPRLNGSCSHETPKSRRRK